jgi:lysozyme|tara:strand:- start:4722 stop:5165 length:444 start_codon:yes stop_codon:yes gene_type:complete
MNIEKLREELKIDEGVKYEIYLDHLSLPTCGVGHLIKETDPEYGLDVGTEISEERVNELFDEDIKVTLDECTYLYEDFYTLPEEAQLIIANMMFNLGRPRLSRFLKMKKHIDNRDFVSASEEMKDSKWYRQVTNRADRLVERMKAID